VPSPQQHPVRLLAAFIALKMRTVGWGRDAEAKRLRFRRSHMTFIYLYPLVTMDLTRRQQTNVEFGAIPGRNPQNTFSHIRTFPPQIGRRW
jgi:hypothetical protein